MVGLEHSIAVPQLDAVEDQRRYFSSRPVVGSIPERAWPNDALRFRAGDRSPSNWSDLGCALSRCWSPPPGASRSTRSTRTAPLLRPITDAAAASGPSPLPVQAILEPYVHLRRTSMNRRGRPGLPRRTWFGTAALKQWGELCHCLGLPALQPQPANAIPISPNANLDLEPT